MLRALLVAGATLLLSGCGPEFAQERPNRPGEASRARPADQVEPKTRQVSVYFLRLEGQELETVPVKRTVPADSPAREALKALLVGPTAAEKAQGLQSEIPAGTRLEGVDLKEGTARAAFSKDLDRDVAGSMRVTAIRRQIEDTLRQFSTVKEVVIEVDGRTEDVLQP